MTKKTTKKNIGGHFSSALNTLTSYAIVFVPLLILLGALDSFLFLTALNLNGIEATQNILNMGLSQSALIKLSFSHLGLMLGTKAIIGPFIAMFAVLFSRATIMDKALSFGEALSFALKRYSSVVKPYILAMLSIQIGSIIVIPGIMFMQQYAFVDSVATLEKEKHVLSRSKRLTNTRKKTLYFLILPYIILGQGIQILEFIHSADLQKLILINMGYEAALILILCSFYSLYHERIALIAERKARKEAKKAAQEAKEDESTAE